jgi:hypothetical protein
MCAHVACMYAYVYMYVHVHVYVCLRAYKQAYVTACSLCVRTGMCLSIRLSTNTFCVSFSTPFGCVCLLIPPCMRTGEEIATSDWGCVRVEDKTVYAE